MLKCDIKENKINFAYLEVGATFLIDSESFLWYGVKVCYSCGDEPIYYIMDISDDIGTLYSDVDMYNIIGLVDLKVVRDEGEV